MKVVNNRTTGKDSNKNQTTNTLRPKFDFYNRKNHNKIKLASDKNQKRI